MKRSVCLLLSLILLFAFAACDTQNAESEVQNSIGIGSENENQIDGKTEDDGLPYDITYTAEYGCSTVTGISVDPEYQGEVHIVIPQTDPEGNTVHRVEMLPVTEYPVLSVMTGESFETLHAAFVENSNELSWHRFSAYYLLKDPEDNRIPEQAREQMKAEYPICNYGPVCVLDGTISFEEILKLSELCETAGIDKQFFADAAAKVVDLFPDSEPGKADFVEKINGCLGYEYLSKVTHITFPKTVSFIDTNGFEGYKNLKKIDGLSLGCVAELKDIGTVLLNEENMKLYASSDYGNFMKTLGDSYPDGGAGNIVQVDEIIIPEDAESKYKEALSCIDKGETEAAYKLLYGLPGYEPAEEILKDFKVCPSKYIMSYPDGSSYITENIYDDRGNVISETYNGQTTEYSCEYDENNNLIKNTGRDSVIEYFYDGNDRLVKKETLADGRTYTEEYVYDDKGNLIQCTTDINRTEYFYDENNVLEKSILHVSDDYSEETVYYYDTAGRLVKTLMYSDNGISEICQYIYEARNIVKEIDEDGAISCSYDDFGNMIKYGNMEYSEFQYFYCPKGE